jgi:methionyl-tRNA formyltransferase
MKQTLPPTVFFGSGPVAATSLELLHQWHSIAVVVTKRTPPHHKELAPVEVFAKVNNLPLLYADNKSELDELQLPAVQYGIVIDYGVIISAAVINKFPLGILNSHFSILPEWRGADPITFALLSGQKETGVSLMVIDEGLDTGNIVAEAPLHIASDETNTSLTEKLIEVSDHQLQTILPLYVEGTAVPMPQSNTRITTYSRKLTKKDGLLGIAKPATVLEREIRAFNEWPKSKIQLGEKLIVIVCSAIASDKVIAQGAIEVTEAKELYIGTRVGALQIRELMPLGKSKMTTSAFLNGYRSHIADSVIV